MHKGKLNTPNHNTRFDADALLVMAQDNTQQGRNKLTKRICDFFKHKLNDQEEKLASDILLSLIKKAELDFKQILAERLSLADNVPRIVILSLVDERISVASHILKNSELLHDTDLLFIIKNKTDEYWQNIAKRKSLSPLVMDSLINTENERTVETLIKNEDVNIPEAVFKKLGVYVMSRKNLQEPLLLRPEVDERIAELLYVCVSNEVRNYIRNNYNLTAKELDRAMQDTLSELLMQAGGEFTVSDEVMQFAIYAYERGEVNAENLTKALRRSQYAYFLALFSLWAEMPVESVMGMIRRQNGSGLVAFCKSKGVVKSEFASLFLLSRGLRSGEKVVNHAELAKSLTEFDRLTQDEAEKLVNMWRTSPDMI